MGIAFMRHIVDSSYSLIAPFLPQLLKAKEITNEDFVRGFIFSTYSIAMMLSAPFITYYLARYERIILLRIGIILLGASILGFGLSFYLLKGNGYVTAIFFARGIQGLASSMVDISVLTIIGVMYEDHMDKALAFILFASCIGYSIAPFIGSLFFNLH